MESTPSKLKFIDLFCGIGGFHQALISRNCECVLACDIDDKCRDVYQQNYGIEPKKDIRDVVPIEIPDFDILCAGFPCQPFSHAGKQEGFEDETRGGLIFKVYDILKCKKPKFIILENVKNIHTHDNGRTWLRIIKDLTDIGYIVNKKPSIISPIHLGIPQNRERVFVHGILNHDKSIYPLVLDKLPTSIETILQTDEEVKSCLEHISVPMKARPVLELWDQFIQHFKALDIKLPSFPIWTEFMLDESTNYPDWKLKIINKNKEFYTKYQEYIQQWLVTARQNINFKGSLSKLEWQCGEFQEGDSIRTLCYQFRPSGIRMKRSTHSPALVAMNQVLYIGSKQRKLTPRECGRLQSFPDTFVPHPDFNTSYKQFGNSVNVEVIKKIYDHLIHYISQSD